MTWQNDKITDKQKEAIENLGFSGEMPETKGKASELISEIIEDRKNAWAWSSGLSYEDEKEADIVFFGYDGEMFD